MSLDIAVIGMACRFPGAPSIDRYWDNLRLGIDSVRQFGRNDLLQAAVPPEVIDSPWYVPAKGVIEGIEYFDSDLFGMPPRECELTDPQHRLMLELVWTCLESSGYGPGTVKPSVGVFAGCGIPSYSINNVIPHLRQKAEDLGGLGILIASDRDHFTSKVSYRLDLRGPSVSVQTACSTSLVAVHLACSSLLSGDCSMAIAGGVNVSVPLTAGYMYQPGGILSPDGVCRPFDAAANGTVFGDGGGVVLLKRLNEAIRDKDTIRAIIIGSGVNNDGRYKIGYTAPSADGERQAICAAIEKACLGPFGYDPSYIEAHGTATPLGDPIEIRALHAVMEGYSPPGHRCAIGSVKGNIGHLDAASGIAGFIKAVLCLEHSQIPPTLHFSAPNPDLFLDSEKLYVNTALESMPKATENTVSVSSFGIGGTNAHIILRQASVHVRDKQPTKEPRLLMLSASTPEDLALFRSELRAFLRTTAAHIDDVTRTLFVGRRWQRVRECAVVASIDELLSTLETKSVHYECLDPSPSAIFQFVIGEEPKGRLDGSDLYLQDKTFGDAIDQCVSTAMKRDIDIRRFLFTPSPAEARLSLRERWLTSLTLHYATFALIAKCCSAPAIKFASGASFCIAACLAEVINIEDSVEILLILAKGMESAEATPLLEVKLGYSDLQWYLDDRMKVDAPHNGNWCLVSADAAQLKLLQTRLANDGVGEPKEVTGFALPLQAERELHHVFEQAFQTIPLKPPTLPLISALTGVPVAEMEAVDSKYWIRQLCSPRGHSEAVITPTRSEPLQLSLATSSLNGFPRSPSMFTLKNLSLREILAFLGWLWIRGHPIKSHKLYADAGFRIPLPGEVMKKQRHWIDYRADATESPSGQEMKELSQLSLVMSTLASNSDYLEILRQMVHNLTGVELSHIGPESSPTDLGVDSLLTIRLSKALNEAFDIEVPPDILLDGNSTMLMIADYLHEAVTSRSSL
jgi:Polyketide synthase modules and related proteins